MKHRHLILLGIFLVLITGLVLFLQMEMNRPKLMSRECSNATYIGSITSNKYHLPECAYVKKILPKNKICFSNAEHAEQLGYEPCSVCLKTQADSQPVPVQD